MIKREKIKIRTIILKGRFNQMINDQKHAFDNKFNNNDYLQIFTPCQLINVEK